MANSINWGKVYCEMLDNSSWGQDTQYTTFYIPDFSAPTCWGTVPVTPFTADLVSYFGGDITVDTTQFRTDRTQL